MIITEIVPSVLYKGAVGNRGAKQVPDLGFGHSQLQLVELGLFNDIALPGRQPVHKRAAADGEAEHGKQRKTSRWAHDG